MPDQLINGHQMRYEVYGQGQAMVMNHGGLGGDEGVAPSLNTTLLPWLDGLNDFLRPARVGKLRDSRRWILHEELLPRPVLSLKRLV